MIEISEQQKSCAWLTARGLILVAVVVLSLLLAAPILAVDTDEQVSKGKLESGPDTWFPIVECWSGARPSPNKYGGVPKLYPR